MTQGRCGTEAVKDLAPGPSTEEARIGSRAKAPALWSCFLAGFATLLDSAVIAYSAPDVGTSLGASTAGVQWFLASFSLTFGLGLVPAGRLGDAFGRRGLLVSGLMLFLLGSIAAVISPSIAVLITARLLQGLGAGVISAQVLGIIQDLTSGGERVRALAKYTAAGALAALIGPVLAGVILMSVDGVYAWRVVLALPILPTLVTIALALRGVPIGERTRVTPGLDLPGIILLGAIAVLITLPVIDPRLPLPLTFSVLASVGLLITGLVLWERRYTRRGRLALFTPVLIRSRGFVIGNLVALLWFGGNLAAVTVATVHFLGAGGVPALSLAVVFGLGALSRLGASGLSHRLYTRFGSSVVRSGLLLQTLCFLALVAAGFGVETDALFFVYAVVQFILGISSGLVEPVLRAVVLSFSPPHVHGAAASLLQLTQRLSATFFVAATTGILLSFGQGGAQQALAWAIGVCALASVLATGFAFDPMFRQRAPAGRNTVATTGPNTHPLE